MGAVPSDGGTLEGKCILLVALAHDLHPYIALSTRQEVKAPRLNISQDIPYEGVQGPFDPDEQVQSRTPSVPCAATASPPPT